MYDRLVGGATTFDSHRQSVDDESSIGTGVDRPSHCHLPTGAEHDTAVETLPSRACIQVVVAPLDIRGLAVAELQIQEFFRRLDRSGTVRAAALHVAVSPDASYRWINLAGLSATPSILE